MNEERANFKAYEARLIQLLRLRFEQANFKVEDHEKVGELPLEIDLIVISADENKKPDFSKLPPLFRYFQRFNLMELKTEKDRLKPGDLLKLQAYGWLYMAKHNIYSIAEVTLSAVVHHLSAAVLNVLPVLGYKLIEPGIFRRDSDMVSYLIATEDLPDEVTPEELQIFSTPARRQKIILSQFLLNRSTPILETVFDLYQSEVLKMIDVKPEFIDKMIETLGHEKLIAALQRTMGADKLLAAFSGGDQDKLIAALSQTGARDKLLAAFSKEELLSVLSKEDVIKALGEEEILKSLWSKLGAEQFQKLLAQIDRN